MTDIKKIKTGNKSTVAGRDINDSNIHNGDNFYLNSTNKSIQIKTIMNLVIRIGEIADTNKPRREDSEKDLNEKLNMRFSEHKEELSNRFSELLDIYSHCYGQALEHLELNETLSDKISLYLRQKSREILTEDSNPINAISKLVTFFNNELNSTLSDKQEYDINAIEFYMYKELIKCNIFPNPLK